MTVRNHLKKFDSLKQYNDYKSSDGWEYPNISFVNVDQDNDLQYNNEMIMRWYDKDTTKIPYFFGDVSHDEFIKWVDNASSPCEIKKDLTEFNYLRRLDFNNISSDYSGLDSIGDSHYNTPDKTEYLQLAEIKNINIGLFKNSKEGWKEVRFNFDKGCPNNFHKWFSHPYWNGSINSYTKLLGRYDVTPKTTSEINCCKGEKSSGNWSYNTALKSMGENINCLSYWEYLVLSYIFCAYYKTFNSQSIASGLFETTSFSNGDSDINNNNNLNNNYYKFMYLENPLHGKQWILTTGFSTRKLADEFEYWFTFDNKNPESTSTGVYPITENPSYITNIDLNGISILNSGSNSTGFYDTFEAKDITSQPTPLVGGSGLDTDCGIFSRNLSHPYDYSKNDYIRLRITVNR